jgi:hypothetical protein
MSLVVLGGNVSAFVRKVRVSLAEKTPIFGKRSARITD